MRCPGVAAPPELGDRPRSQSRSTRSSFAFFRPSSRGYPAIPWNLKTSRSPSFVLASLVGSYRRPMLRSGRSRQSGRGVPLSLGFTRNVLTHTNHRGRGSQKALVGVSVHRWLCCAERSLSVHLAGSCGPRLHSRDLQSRRQPTVTRRHTRSPRTLSVTDPIVNRTCPRRHGAKSELVPPGVQEETTLRGLSTCLCCLFVDFLSLPGL